MGWLVCLGGWPQVYLAGSEEKLGATPSRPVNSHSIGVPYSLAILSALVREWRIGPRIAAACGRSQLRAVVRT